MSKQTSLDLGPLIDVVQIEVNNPMVRAYGRGPLEAKCKTSQHLIRKKWDKTYYKCALREQSNSARTDHLANWLACGKYKEDK